MPCCTSIYTYDTYIRRVSIWPYATFLIQSFWLTAKRVVHFLYMPMLWVYPIECLCFCFNRNKMWLSYCLFWMWILLCQYQSLMLKIQFNHLEHIQFCTTWHRLIRTNFSNIFSIMCPLALIELDLIFWGGFNQTKIMCN